MLSVPPEKWDEFQALCRREGVEATIIGQFVPTGRLQLNYRRAAGRRPVDGVLARRPSAGRARGASTQPPPAAAQTARRQVAATTRRRCWQILGSLNVASKEWVIRQYDHEVQGGSVDQAAGRRRTTTARATRPWCGRCSTRSAGIVDRLRHESRATATSTRITWPPAPSTRRCATAWPSGPIRRGSRFSTTSAGAIRDRPETLGLAGARGAWPATTWPSRWARRSSAAKTA